MHCIAPAAYAKKMVTKITAGLGHWVTVGQGRKKTTPFKVLNHVTILPT